MSAIDPLQLRQTIIQELGLGSLPTDKREEILEKIAEILLKQIFLTTMDRLGDAGVCVYEKLLDSNPSVEVVEGFLKARIPDYDAMVKSEADLYIQNLKRQMR